MKTRNGAKGTLIASKQVQFTARPLSWGRFGRLGNGEAHYYTKLWETADRHNAVIIPIPAGKSLGVLHSTLNVLARRRGLQFHGTKTAVPGSLVGWCDKITASATAPAREETLS